MNIQEAIDTAGDGATIKVPMDQYLINGVTGPIKLKSGITLDLSGSVVKVMPTDQGYHKAVTMEGIEDAKLIGGMICGERDLHIGFGEAGGYGVNISHGSERCSVQGTSVKEFWGDGVFINQARDIQIEKLVADKNRRQGMSVIDANGLTVTSSQFSHSGGTPPEAGVDLEPDQPYQAVRNIVFRKNIFFGNGGAGLLICAPRDRRSNIDVDDSNKFIGQPIDGNDGIVPVYAKWLHEAFSWMPGYNWWFYPRTLKIA